MKKEFEMLKAWMLNYIKNKDILLKSITSIDENKEGWDIIVNKKGGKKYYIIRPEIDDGNELFERMDYIDVTIVVLNKKKNFDFLLDNWTVLKDYPKLCMIFVNPNSELEKKWLVFPNTHDKVTETESLKKGLKALFQTVDLF